MATLSCHELLRELDRKGKVYVCPTLDLSPSCENSPLAELARSDLEKARELFERLRELEVTDVNSLLKALEGVVEHAVDPVVLGLASCLLVGGEKHDAASDQA